METRLWPRVSVDMKISSRITRSDGQSIALAEGDQFEAKSYDISIAGIGIFIKVFLPKGLLIEMDLDGAPFGLTESIKTRGEVRHCNSIGTRKYRCGLRFLNLLPEHKKAIAQLIPSK